jgi:hypothetical protein
MSRLVVELAAETFGAVYRASFLGQLIAKARIFDDMLGTAAARYSQELLLYKANSVN